MRTLSEIGAKATGGSGVAVGVADGDEVAVGDGVTDGVTVALGVNVMDGVSVRVAVGRRVAVRAGSVGGPHEGLSRVASPSTAGVHVASGDGVDVAVGAGAGVRAAVTGDSIVSGAPGGAATVQAVKASEIRPARIVNRMALPGA
jgi:hypothetical protein